jgi:hypothetical protein
MMNSQEIIEKLKAHYKTFNEIPEHFDLAEFVKKDLTEDEKTARDAKLSIRNLKHIINDIIFLVKASELKETEFSSDKPLRTEKALFSDTKTGDFVAVRPCGDEYDNKTFLGVYLGEAALSQIIKIEDNKIKTELGFYNPAIFVPDLNEIIYGCASWWGKIKSPDDLKQISDVDINNVWYVKVMKTIAQAEKE